MYAIIETGGKQFRVEEGARICVEKLDAAVGSEVSLDRVLMLGGVSCAIGAPYVPGARVLAKVLDHGKGDKVLVFKKWRRNDSRKLQGHRQPFTALKITGIEGLAQAGGEISAAPDVQYDDVRPDDIARGGETNPDAAGAAGADA
jgi:large subunit ribosomal protein L21